MKTRHKQLEREYKKALHRYPHVYWALSDFYPFPYNKKLPRKQKKARQKLIKHTFGGV